MSSLQNEINYSYVPPFNPVSVYVLVKVDKPESIRVGASHINVETGVSTGGIELPTAKTMKEMGLAINTETQMYSTDQHEREVRINIEAETQVTVVKIGPSAFHRAGLEDMLKSVKPGIRVWIKDFSGVSLKDPDGRRTLYYYVLEQQICALVEDIADEFK